LTGSRRDPFIPPRLEKTFFADLERPGFGGSSLASPGTLPSRIHIPNHQGQLFAKEGGPINGGFPVLLKNLKFMYGTFVGNQEKHQNKQHYQHSLKHPSCLYWRLWNAETIALLFFWIQSLK
jgi:hypothetical protein